MKLKVLAFILALTVISWTQTSSQNPQISPEKLAQAATADSAAPGCHHADGKDGASCCENVKAEGKNGMSCCAHHDMAAGEKESMPCCHHADAKDAGAKDPQHEAACCNGKDGKSCMKNEKSANASTNKTGCCPDGACCGKGKSCCDSAKDTKTTAMACCSGNSCGTKGHEDMAKEDMSK